MGECAGGDGPGRFGNRAGRCPGQSWIWGILGVAGAAALGGCADAHDPPGVAGRSGTGETPPTPMDAGPGPLGPVDAAGEDTVDAEADAGPPAPDGPVCGRAADASSEGFFALAAEVDSGAGRLELVGLGADGDVVPLLDVTGSEPPGAAPRVLDHGNRRAIVAVLAEVGDRHVLLVRDPRRGTATVELPRELLGHLIRWVLDDGRVWMTAAVPDRDVLVDPWRAGPPESHVMPIPAPVVRPSASPEPTSSGAVPVRWAAPAAPLELGFLKRDGEVAVGGVRAPAGAVPVAGGWLRLDLDGRRLVETGEDHRERASVPLPDGATEVRRLGRRRGRVAELLGAAGEPVGVVDLSRRRIVLVPTGLGRAGDPRRGFASGDGYVVGIRATPRWQLDLAAGTDRRVDAPGDPFQRALCGTIPFVATSGGDLGVARRGPDGAGLYLGGMGSPYRRFGRPVRDVDVASIVTHAGTWALATWRRSHCGVGEPDDAPFPDDVVAGPSLQLIRPGAAGSPLVLDRYAGGPSTVTLTWGAALRGVQLDGTGTCVAWTPDGSGAGVVLHDLETGRRAERAGATLLPLAFPWPVL